MKKIITAAAILFSLSGSAQTVKLDTVNKFYYVNITPVVWQYSEPSCDRVYITDYNSDMSTAANVSIQLGYLAFPNTWAHFVAPPVVMTFTGSQYDSVRSLGKAYIFTTFVRTKGLVITE